MSEAQRRVVYVLRSIPDPDRHYVGRTADIAGRLASHNAGESPQTTRHRPWQVVVLVQFVNEQRAAEFEKFLKSSTGRAFARQHFA
jgi:predicted GIY-YIG superfamily endonuclease